jgi:transcriptional regulator with XRE-family HTH domain
MHLIKQICDMALSKEQVVKNVGLRIRQIRNDKQLTIEKVAFDSGMEYTQLSRIEHGKINTSIYHIYKISRSLDILISEIFIDLP